MNKFTARALEDANFKTDSSISSQRFDGPFTFGAKNKLKWLYAPRKPYYLSYESPVKKGKSKILEIPISAFLLPFIGTTMRISPFVTKAILSKVLYFESSKTNKPIVFLFHPNECLDISQINYTRRASNIVEYVFADYIRQKLKMRNLGHRSIKIFDEILAHTKKYDFEFISVKEYEKKIRSQIA
jgi:hypothetical protein